VSNTINSTDSLLISHRVPRQIEINQRVRSLEVQPPLALSVQMRIFALPSVKFRSIASFPTSPPVVRILVVLHTTPAVVGPDFWVSVGEGLPFVFTRVVVLREDDDVVKCDLSQRADEVTQS
jgi:hypothetical protein